MYFLIFVLFLVISISPAASQELKAEIPKLDQTKFIDWSPWHCKLREEVLRKLIKRAISMNLRLGGQIEILGEIDNAGSVSVKEVLDNSVNMGLILPNILESMSYTSCTDFPQNSSREKVSLDLIVRAENPIKIYSLEDREYLK